MFRRMETEVLGSEFGGGGEYCVEKGNVRYILGVESRKRREREEHNILR